MAAANGGIARPVPAEAVAPGMAPLAVPGWQHVDKISMAEFRAPDWTLLERQKAGYLPDRQAAQVLAWLRLMEGDASWGYQITMFQHGLQAATMAWRDGLDEETVAVTLLHDIGFMVCASNHGAIAAALLAPYVSEANAWMLAHHQIFQNVHLHEHPGDADPDERERWRGHPHFAWTAEFLARYDVPSNDPHYETAPLSFFEPMVRRLFARPPKRVVPA